MSKQNPTIMVVEDEVLLLQAITKKIKLANMDVLSCSSGQQALDYLNNLDELPDAVQLDYYLKDMNGLDFMQKLKENPKWAHIPVIVVSNSASPDKVNNMLALGAKKYLLKAEFRLDEIIKILKEFIQDEDSVVGGQPLPQAVVASVAVPAPMPAPTQPMPQAASIDPSQSTTTPNPDPNQQTS